MSENHSRHHFPVRITKETFFNYIKHNNSSFQYNYLGGADLVRNINIYKLSNYKEALFEAGISSSIDDDVVIKNITEIKKYKVRAIFRQKF
tara:strand:+ start:3384 stop:3656 length:273 start_codon:yes stop_codon:yes gene_type:complete